MTSDTYTKAAKTFRLLADPTRLKLLRVIEKGRGTLCVSELAKEINATVSATSHQLAKLQSLGIVRACREGKEVCYCIEPNAPMTRHVKALLRIANAS